MERERPSEIEALSRLHALAEVCASTTASADECLRQILETALWMTGAHKGTLQLFDASSTSLKLVAHQGLPGPFVEFFASVQMGDAAACEDAFRTGTRAIVENADESLIFAGRASRDVLREAGVMAVQSTPLKGSNGDVLGIVSTHFDHPHRLTDEESRLLDVLARQAGDYLAGRRADEALRAASTSLRVITENMAAAVTRCSRDLRYVWVSKGYAEWINRTVDDVTGQPIVDVVGQDGFEQLLPHFERVLSGQVVRYEELVPFRTIGARWIMSTYTPTVNDQGACDGWVAVVTDITDRKRAEEALKEANSRKDEFLAMLGHELRNPLSAVRNAIATASFEGEHRDAALAIARRQAEQLSRLVDDLLDAARINQGRINVRREPVLLNRIVDNAVEASQLLFDERRHTLIVEPFDEEIYVDGDQARLEQVFVNLLSNACKYTDPGGQISISMALDKAQAAVRVRDSGTGITPEIMPRIFDLFAQADRTLDRAQGGLGIGLTLAHRIVELHGGQIEASSAGLGKGSEFVVRLPVLEGYAPNRAMDRVVAGKKKALRILIVEDNVDAAESLRFLLEVDGHQVRVAHSGTVAIEMALAHRPDVVLIDIGLPGMDGYEIARRFRLESALRAASLIAVTGYGRDQDSAAAIAAGFDEYLVKPVDPDALRTLIQETGRRHSSYSNRQAESPLFRTASSR